MSESSSLKHRSVGAGSAGNNRRRVTLATAGILLALTFAVLLLRLYQLTEIPPGLMLDEGAHGVDALQVLKGEHAVFFPENNGREGLIVYAVALATSLLGRTMLALRLPTALASAATVFGVFWLGQLLFGRDEVSGRAAPWRGLLIGGVGAGLLAVSLGQTIIGRTAYRANFLPLLLCLCLALLWQGWSQRSWAVLSRWRARRGGCCRTPISRRASPHSVSLPGSQLSIDRVDTCGRGRAQRGRSSLSPIQAAFRAYSEPLR